ncbi:hypothetical protein FQN57_005361 [Myotisia sp. PD_48]|nr:hypothetical protein FQN57_005361 [Myotisia sp. PD_48]
MAVPQIGTTTAVSVSLNELVEGTVSFETLTKAFGPSSLGIIFVKDLPPQFETLRLHTLSNASYLAALSSDELESLTSEESKYLVGWSCGKETLKSGHFDTLKGSYYVNCAFYNNPALQNAPADEYPDFPQYTAPNIWPPAEKLPKFRQNLTELCTLIIDTAALVARACDRYAEANIAEYTGGYLERVVKTSLTTKARLLHYFPVPAGATVNGDDDDDDWCATHVDHGCLTGLTSAMFVDEEANNPADYYSRNSISDKETTLPELATSPDPEAGLYIRSRSGDVVKINIPKDCIAFQTGEALELITKGKFKAVPHFVKGAKTGGKIARNTLAVFTQPNLSEEVEPGKTFADFARGIVEKNH